MRLSAFSLGEVDGGFGKRLSVESEGGEGRPDVEGGGSLREAGVDEGGFVAEVSAEGGTVSVEVEEERAWSVRVGIEAGVGAGKVAAAGLAEAGSAPVAVGARGRSNRSAGKNGIAVIHGSLP